MTAFTCPIHVPNEIYELIDAGALFVLNDSGGKDSQAMRIALRAVVPAAQQLVIANPALYHRYVEIERRTGYTMHQSRKPLQELTGIVVPASLVSRN